VVARSEHGGGGPVPQSERTQRLAAAVRSAAAAAADQVGGGVALVFACAPGENAPEGATRLRAAAGFASAQAARDAAKAVLPHVREVLEARAVGAFAAAPEFGERAAAGLQVHPLVWEGQVHGALAVGTPRPLQPALQQALASMAETLALRFDHARLAELHEELGQAAQPLAEEEEKSEEILKLSEALFAQDIELLRTNEKLAKVEKLKSDFIERMSRELRTPLNSIIEAIISVLTGENETLSEAAKQSLRSALDDGTGFLRTLQNILDLWRLKQGELPLEIQDVNFRETVDEAIFSVQDAIGEKPISVEPVLAENFPKIRTDLTKISQILFLLLENAVKFTPSGTVTIAARVEDGVLHCDVSDTGIGICADDQQYVFDEFYQVDAASSRRYAGAGLGLALVRDLVTLMSGEIALKSEVGAGSTFSVSLPVQVVG
jgi:signal transduction histidine kinase